jgi:transposase, IS5 family
MKQTTFASLAWSNKGKVTRRERFLAEMDAVMPWARLLGLIEPRYPSDGLGRPRKDLELMLRVYFLQQWFNLSDPQAEESLYDSESMRRFAGIELGDTAVPDESTILRFRHLLEEHQLTRAIFEQVRALLEERNLYLKSGTIVDATIISAPSSTKNADERRDPEMGSTKKGASWHFGMKVHIGTDKRGLTHEITATSARVNDFTQLPELLHGQEQELYGDRSYWSEEHRWLCREVGIRYRVNRRGKRARELTPAQRRINRSRSRIRARVEHPFNVVKRLWGFTKVRYRGVAKNLARAYSMFALANLYLVRRRLMPPGGKCAL